MLRLFVPSTQNLNTLSELHVRFLSNKSVQLYGKTDM